MVKTVLEPPHQPAPAAAAISPQYHATARPVVSLPEPPAVHQWPSAQPVHAAYLAQSQPSSIMAAGAPTQNPPTDGPPGMHDPAMLQAAQLLLPGDYQAACQYFSI